jgi:crotonobetainyl-CoA:carnitine CoA-transferase CaiB-like acyl-CoA transferase
LIAGRELDGAKPLAGIRILELARILAGPWCGQLLADLGADVVKIERAGEGDDTRQWGPPFVGGERSGSSAAYFHACNRGKRSFTADFECEADRAAVREAAAEADIVIENFKVGGLKRYGLDHESLRAANPSLITCSITGFGQTGPYAHRAGYDFVVQGMGGIMDLTGEQEGEPQKTGVAFADIFSGVYSAVAILASLRRREATGVGAHIDMSLLDVQVAVLGNQAMNYLVSGHAPTRMGNAHPNIVPYQLFPTLDGPVIVAAGNDAQFYRFSALVGRSDLAHDPRFLRNADRVLNRSALVSALSTATASMKRDTLLTALEAGGVPAGPVNALDQVFADPHVKARGMQVDLPDGVETVPTVRCPIIIDGEPMSAATASPKLGENIANPRPSFIWTGFRAK